MSTFSEEVRDRLTTECGTFTGGTFAGSGQQEWHVERLNDDETNTFAVRLVETDHNEDCGYETLFTQEQALELGLALIVAGRTPVE